MNSLSNVQIREFMRGIPDQLHSMNYETVVKTCNYFFKSLPLPVFEFINEKFQFGQRNTGGRNIIYRARHIKREDNCPHDLLSEISYIPNSDLSKIKNFGRANKPFESMFYGSLNIPTACTEAVTKGNVFEKKSSVMLTVGMWEFRTPLNFITIPHSEKHFKSFYDRNSFVSESIQLKNVQQQNSHLKQTVNDDFGFEKLIFFADQFAKWDIKNDYEYKLSNYFADRVFNRIPEFDFEDEIDGIIYPSVALSFQERNIVLRPDVVDTKLKFIGAQQIWFVVDLKGNSGAQFIPIRSGKLDDTKGRIIWSRR